MVLRPKNASKHAKMAIFKKAKKNRFFLPHTKKYLLKTFGFPPGGGGWEAKKQQEGG